MKPGPGAGQRLRDGGRRSNEQGLREWGHQFFCRPLDSRSQAWPVSLEVLSELELRACRQAHREARAAAQWSGPLDWGQKIVARMVVPWRLAMKSPS